MYRVRKLKDDVFYIGASDRRLALFENIYPIPRGVSYNSYLIMDEKTVLLDTVDRSVTDQFFENLEHALGGRKLDYLIVNHMEPDHCHAIADVVRRYEGVQLVGNAKTLTMLGQFNDIDLSGRFTTVKEGDTLDTGRHKLVFCMAPMVHWPEAMVTYDAADKILFSADAFGTFGALGGNIYADEVRFETEWLDDARRYYTNIVGKYGPQVQALLKKASGLEIAMICPLHGPIWRENLGWFIDKYVKWSTYTPEEKAVVVAYASIYGGTENAADIVADRLADRGVRNIVVYDLSSTHPSVIVSEAFRCSHLVLLSASYNGGLFDPMQTVLHDLAAHNLQNRTVAIVENGTWAPTAGKEMERLISGMKNINLLDQRVTVRSTVKEEQREQLAALADRLAETLL